MAGFGVGFGGFTVPRPDGDRIDLVWDKLLEPDFRKFTAQVAREVLREEQRRGFGPTPIVVTDGRYGAPPESVKFGGKIEFADLTSAVQIAEAVREELIRRSPVGDRPKQVRYKDSHIYLLDRKTVPSLEWLRENWRLGQTLTIVNTKPYASLIEGADAHSRWRTGSRGKKDGSTRSTARRAKGISKQASNGVYRVVWAWARRRFGRAAFIEFRPIKLAFMGVEVWGMSGGTVGGKKSKGIRKRASLGGRSWKLRDQIYPAIHIRQLSSISQGLLQ